VPASSVKALGLIFAVLTEAHSLELSRFKTAVFPADGDHHRVRHHQA